MATSDHINLQTFMTGVKRRNPGQPEFIQAVQEVAQDVFDFISDKGAVPRVPDPPPYRRARPDHQFPRLLGGRQGNIRVQRGWRVQNNNAIGPYKGGIRFHPSVTESVLKFLAFEQTFNMRGCNRTADDLKLSFSAGGWTTSDRHDPELKETIHHDQLADRKIVDRRNPRP